MRAVARLLAEARALGLLRGLAFDAAAMALIFAALAGLWIATPGASAHPSPATATEDSALATGAAQ